VSARDLASRPQPFGVVCRSGNGKWWLVTLPAHSRGVSARQLVSLAQEGMAAPPLTPPPRPGLPPTPTFLLLPLFALRPPLLVHRAWRHPPAHHPSASTDRPTSLRTSRFCGVGAWGTAVEGECCGSGCANCVWVTYCMYLCYAAPCNRSPRVSRDWKQHRTRTRARHKQATHSFSFWPSLTQGNSAKTMNGEEEPYSVCNKEGTTRLSSSPRVRVASVPTVRGVWWGQRYHYYY
jgi:hypothetical protein